MFRLIRVRLALSYAGIALLVTLSLGAVLLVRLRAYYANQELEYLNGNAKAMSIMAAPLLENKYPKDVQDAQVSNLAFLSQTRVRILDPQKNVLADSGPWQGTKLGIGVVKARFNGGNADVPKSDAVIIIQRNGPDTAVPGPGGSFISIGGDSKSAPAIQVQPYPAPDGPVQNSVERGDTAQGFAPPPDVIYFNSSVSVSNKVYGFALSSVSVSEARSNQMVVKPIDTLTGAPLGYVELSESPAYGREIVSSVASGLAVAGGLAILLAIVTGWLVSRRLTAPLVNLTQATQQMSNGDLAVRVAEANRPDEFGILGKSFNQMAGRIEETVQTLRRFLADAAHELQTPLTALRTNLELARSEANSAATDTYLVQALEQIDRLQRLIKDLLNLSHLESATNGEVFQQVDLKDLVHQTIEPFAARAEQAGQTLNLDLLPGEALVLGGADKLRSALGNLLDNALKFTPSGGAITVRLCAEAGDLCLTVSDTGIGIPPGEVEMLFNRFHRGRNASTYPGSGLGLAIVRAIAQAHGGYVRAANNPDGGASFTLCLPRLAEEPATFTEKG